MAVVSTRHATGAAGHATDPRHVNRRIPPQAKAALPAVVIVGRSNGTRSPLLDLVVAELAGQGMSALVFETRRQRTSRWFRQEQSRFLVPLVPDIATARAPAKVALRLAFRAALLVGHPWRLDHLLTRPFRNRPPAVQLRRFLRAQGARPLILVSHSAGGVAGAMAEGLPHVRGHVCLGYPFRHPGRADEAYRTRPLARVRHPMLIVQGDADAYGTAEAARRYDLAPAITVLPVRSDHDYDRLPAEDLAAVVQAVRQMADRPA